MSSLNTFKVLALRENILEVEVAIDHPDEHHINGSANFALQIILEFYEDSLEFYEDSKLKHIDNNHGQGSCPFNQGGADALKPENKPILDDLLQKMRGRKIEVNETEYNEVSKTDQYKYKGQKLAAIGRHDGCYTFYLEPEHDAFCKEADYHIMLVEVMSVKDFPHWFDRVETWLEYGKLSDFDEEAYDEHQNDPAPSYVLRITVNPESSFLLSHIAPGCYRDSAAYDFTH